MLKHSFVGDGWGYVEPLASCETGRTSVEFATRSLDCLLLYNGPMYDDEPLTDFMSIELVGGYPRVRVDLGAGELVLDVDGTNGAGQETLSPLNDGRWHLVEVFKDAMVRGGGHHSNSRG